MLRTEAPTREELARRASDLVPLLREWSLWIDEHRRLPEEVIEAVEESGILRMGVPAQYGGYESDAHTLLDVHAELARGDGSAAFCVSVWSLLNWMAGLWPDEVQDEVFSTPHVRVCGTLSPTGTATRVDGGWLLSGTWRFNSGVLHSHWKIAGAVPTGPEADDGPITALVPAPDFQVVDDWHTIGLSGTGSVTVTASDVFVPDRQAIRTSDFFRDQCKSKVNAQKAHYQIPMLVYSTAATAGQFIGAAKYAMENLMERMPGRRITYTDYDSQAEAPITHLQVGEATLLIEEAEGRMRRFADLIAAKVAADEPWTQDERVVSRVQLGRTAQLAKQALEIVAMAAGGSSVFRDVPILRIQRDVHAAAIHGLTNPNTTTELYGRLLCGLPPNTPYL